MQTKGRGWSPSNGETDICRGRRGEGGRDRSSVRMKGSVLSEPGGAGNKMRGVNIGLI